MALPVTFVAGNVLEAQQLNDSFIYVEPGFKLVAAASFSAVSTVSMAAGVFTTTYDEYDVVFTITAATSNGTGIGIRVNNAGAPRTGSDYAYQFVYRQSNGFSNGADASGQTSLTFGYVDTVPRYRTRFTVSLPASTTQRTRLYGNIVCKNSDNAQNISGTWGGDYATAEANDGLTFFPASGTISGYYRVYGMRQS